ncbi:DUF2157 domain-containing protein [Pseudomonas aeruginosa]
MQPIDRAQAQQRANDILVFQRELQRLDQEQAFRLEPAQARQLADYHLALLDSYRDRFDIDHDLRSQQLSLGMRVASFFGALAFAASVFLLFYRFWGLFPTVAQVAILIGSAFAAFFATLWVQAKDASGYFSKLAAMVAFACFVLDLTMLGQIFNVTPSDLALVPWALYALLLAYLCNARLLLAAAILCVMGFIAARVGTWGGGYWLSVGERPENFFPAAALIFAVPLCFEQRNFSGFAVIYRVFALLGLFLPMLVLANWGSGSYLALPSALIEGLYQVAGFVAAALVIWLGARRNWADVRNTGITFFVIFLYTKFFDWWWEAMPKYLFFLVLGLSALLILLVLRRLRTPLGIAARTDA